MKILGSLIVILLFSSNIFAQEAVRKSEYILAGTDLTNNDISMNERLKSYKAIYTFFINNNQIAKQVFNFSGELESQEGQIPDGIVKEYFSSGALKMETPYLNNQEDGLAKVYYESGELSETVNFENGKLHGPAKSYYKNGQPQMEHSFKKGLLEGTEKLYYENGQLELAIDYRDGTVVGVPRMFNQDGTLSDLKSLNKIKADLLKKADEIKRKQQSLENRDPLLGPDHLAKDHLQSLWTAAEAFKTANQGKYPANIEDLTENGPPFLSDNFCDLSMAGFVYHCEFTQNGYRFWAVPLETGVSGSDIFFITNEGILKLGWAEFDNDEAKTKSFQKIQRERFANGRIKDETILMGNDIIVHSFDPDGILLYEKSPLNNKSETIERRYHQNGQLKSEVLFRNDKEIGSKTYYENGNPSSIDNCNLEKSDCIEELYDDNGQLISKRQYKNGKIFNDLLGSYLTIKKEIQEKGGSGQIRFYENGVEYEEIFRDGKLINKKSIPQTSTENKPIVISSSDEMRDNAFWNHNQRGNNLRDEKKYTEAVIEYKEMLKINPRHKLPYEAIDFTYKLISNDRALTLEEENDRQNNLELKSKNEK